MSKVLIFGCGGHAVSCFEVLKCEGHEIAGFVKKPDEKLDKKNIIRFNLSPQIPIFSETDDLMKISSKAVIGIGQIKTCEPRKNLFKKLSLDGFDLINVISSQANVSKYTTLGKGVFIFKEAIINANVSIGNNCIINTGSIIEHDCNISNDCHVSVGSIINGNVDVGAGTFIGSGAVIKNGISIGDSCVISAGKYVSENVPSGTVLK
jgi:sugar O-acyltransferase (sialic acid O-acetyltransferase NeuD family)